MFPEMMRSARAPPLACERATASIDAHVEVSQERNCFRSARTVETRTGIVLCSHRPTTIISGLSQIKQIKLGTFDGLLELGHSRQRCD